MTSEQWLADYLARFPQVCPTCRCPLYLQGAHCAHCRAPLMLTLGTGAVYAIWWGILLAALAILAGEGLFLDFIALSIKHIPDARAPGGQILFMIHIFGGPAAALLLVSAAIRKSRFFRMNRALQITIALAALLFTLAISIVTMIILF